MSVPTDFGPDSGGRLKVIMLTVTVYNTYLPYLTFTCLFLVIELPTFKLPGSDCSKADSLRQRGPLLRQETRGGRPYPPMDRLREAVRQRRHVCVHQED